MAALRYRTAISLDGFAAGPNQSEADPLGVGGLGLHEWVFSLRSWRAGHGLDGGDVNASDEVLAAATANVGATIMGRNMFDHGRGPWDESWEGWWGDDPPFHHPVFVLTHHPRAPIAKEGGTTFTFVTDGIESALAQAREAAGGQDVLVAGGAHTAQQYLAAGLLDELLLHVVPILLGDGERPFADLGATRPQFEIAEIVDAPGVTHMRYRVIR